MTTMTKQEQQLMKNPQTRLDMVREYLLTHDDSNENRQHLKDAFKLKLKTKKGHKDWFKYCHQDWLNNMPAAERAEWDKRSEQTDAKLAHKGYLPAVWHLMLVAVTMASLLFITIIMFAIYFTS